MTPLERLLALGISPFRPGQVWKTRCGYLVRIDVITRPGPVYTISGRITNRPDEFDEASRHTWTQYGKWDAASTANHGLDLVELLDDPA